MKNKRYYNAMANRYASYRINGISKKEAINKVKDEIIATAIGTLMGINNTEARNDN